MKQISTNIEIPALTRLSLDEIKKSESLTGVSGESRILKNISPENSVKLSLVNFLEDKENFIKPGQIEDRMNEYKDSLLGYQHAKWLVDNQPKFSELKNLEALIYFPGTEVILAEGLQVIPYLEHDGNWIWSLDWATVGLFDMDKSVYIAIGS